MTFDWADYEKLARSLRNGDEAARRSAISRLYYSVYHRALRKYAAEINRLTEVVEESFLLAERILQWLESIQPDQPAT